MPPTDRHCQAPRAVKAEPKWGSAWVGLGWGLGGFLEEGRHEPGLEGRVRFGCRGGCGRLWVAYGLPGSHEGDSFLRARGEGWREEGGGRTGPVGRVLSGAAASLPPVWSPLPAPLWQAGEGSGLGSSAKVGRDGQESPQRSTRYRTIMRGFPLFSGERPWQMPTASRCVRSEVICKGPTSSCDAQ